MSMMQDDRSREREKRNLSGELTHLPTYLFFASRRNQSYETAVYSIKPLKPKKARVDLLTSPIYEPHDICGTEKEKHRGKRER